MWWSAAGATLLRNDRYLRFRVAKVPSEGTAQQTQAESEGILRIDQEPPLELLRPVEITPKSTTWARPSRVTITF